MADEFLRERIFEPLDMPDTSLYTAGRRRSASRPCTHGSGKLEATPRDLSNVVYFSGAGRLWPPSKTICSSRRC